MRIALLSYIAAPGLPTLAQLVGVSVNGILVNSTIPANVSSGFRAGAARVDTLVCIPPFQKGASVLVVSVHIILQMAPGKVCTIQANQKKGL